VAFRKLLEQKHPEAVKVHAAFTTGRDHSAFNAAVINIVRGGQQKSADDPVAKKKSTTSKDVCRNFLHKGKCAHGNACKFSHDIPEAGQSALMGQEEKKPGQKIAKISLSAPKQPPISSNPQQEGKPAQTQPPAHASSYPARESQQPTHTETLGGTVDAGTAPI
jgi:FtsZ-interacting cell division protein ZipA